MRTPPQLSHDRQPVPASIVDELAKGLPRWIGWVPGLWVILRRRLARWHTDRQVQNNVALQLFEVRIDITEVDRGTIHIGALCANFSNHPVTVDSVAVHGVQVGASNLERPMEKGQVSGGSRAHAVGLVSFEIALPSASIRSVVRGITNAVNAKSSPGADVRIYGEVTCWARGRRFLLPFELAAANVRSAISSTVIAEVLENPQSHARPT